MEKNLIVNFHEHHVDKEADITVLLPVGKDNSLKARQMAKENPSKIIPFHYVDVNNPMDDELRQLKRGVERWGVKSVKFQPMDQHIYPSDKKLYPIYEYCEKMGLVVTWHAGVVDLGHKYEQGVPMLSKYCDPIHIDEVAFDFPDMNICIAHLGGNYMYTALVLAEKHENVFLDTAFLCFFGPRFFPPATPSALITHAVNVAGEDKILYGGEGVTPKDVLDADITDEAKIKILGMNAVKLLGLQGIASGGNDKKNGTFLEL